MAQPTIALPKWPAMVVQGMKVTERQASEILIRTSCLPDLSINDKIFESELRGLFGAPYIEDAYKTLKGKELTAAIHDYYDHLGVLQKKLKIIPLEYLGNHQIASSWIGGPHGWCNWSGNIFSNNYNIGKWPSVEEVLKEWELIAKEFPFLELCCWLHAKETCEEENYPIVCFRVFQGGVTLISEDFPPCAPVVESDVRGLMRFMKTGQDYESGITIEGIKKRLIEVYGVIPQYGEE